MKILHECHVTHVLWVIWDAEFDSGFIFKCELRKGQCQIKLGQIRSFFSNSKVSYKKHAYFI